jgi:hypothetical protein
MTPEMHAVPNVYSAYEAAVNALYQGNPGHKRLAKELSDVLPIGLLDDGFVEPLFQCFSHTRWEEPTSAARSNWLWRSSDTGHSDDSAEVRLEREIASKGGTDWSFQMSTMSGVFDSTSHGRRAIDLVHRISPDEYALIELKVNSNNPVYAAFEILGYALAYCQARRHADVHSQPSDRDVLRARKIRLVVLAPSEWYTFKIRGKGVAKPFALAPLASALNAGLERLRAILALPSFDALSFEFRCFDEETELLKHISEGHLGGTLLIT